MEELLRILGQAFGTGDPAQELTVAQVVIRGVTTYAVALVLIRVSENRFLGKATPIDILLGFLIGSMLSRAINGSSQVLPSLVCVAVLLFLHRGLAHAAFRLPRLGHLMKGKEQRLATDGRIDWSAMRRNAIGEHDLEESLRTSGRSNDVDSFAEVVLERNGQISVVKKREQGTPRILDVKVADGVQTVRIAIE